MVSSTYLWWGILEPLLLLQGIAAAEQSDHSDMLSRVDHHGSPIGLGMFSSRNQWNMHIHMYIHTHIYIYIHIYIYYTRVCVCVLIS